MAEAVSPSFLTESPAMLPCFAFFLDLASPKMTSLSISSLFEANGPCDFSVLAPRLPFFGILLVLGISPQWCILETQKERNSINGPVLNLNDSEDVGKTDNSLKKASSLIPDGIGKFPKIVPLCI